MLISAIKLDKSKRLWIVITLAIITAIFLIIIAFFSVYNKENRKVKTNKNELFLIKSYIAEYDLTTFSNKNQNTYHMKEWYLNDNEKENFKFDFKNEEDEHVIFTILDKSINITSDKQISSLNIDDYNVSKTNLLSISTFFNIYNNFLEKENENIKLETKNIDENTHYIVNINNINNKNMDNANESLSYFSFLLNKGLKISKIELIVNNDNIPIEYYVVDENSKVFLSIKFTNFDIKSKIDEKIFANFNK